MSSVSQIAQIPGDTTHASVPSATGPTQPATAFADLLDKPQDNKKQAKKATPDHPAYSFAELGMFGIHAVADDTTKVKPAARATAHAKPAAMDKETKTPATSGSKSATGQPLVFVPFIYGEVTAAAAPAEPSDAPAGFASVAAALPSKPTASSSSKPAAAGSPQQPKADTSHKPLPQSVDKKVDDVSVTVAGPDEGLKIALRGPAEPSAEIVKLRRLIDATVAHFEMDIAELHFNGSAIDSAFSLGGMNGNVGG